MGVRGTHSPSGKRRRKDRAGGMGARAVLLSPGLHPLLGSDWGPIRISASWCVQPVSGLSDGSIMELGEKSQQEHLE